MILFGTAALLALGHTLAGPDHYLPFVAMSRVGRWTLRRTIVVTVLCGMGHVLSSVVLGFIGVFFGIALLGLERIEGFRGDLAAWLMLAFGAAYTAWGLRQAVRNRPHTHVHTHADGTVHAHPHGHHGEHLHVHTVGPAFQPVACTTEGAESMTPWILFTIFLFGPCEPLIPLLIYPAAHNHMFSAVLVALVFGTITIATMTAIVTLAYMGLDRFPLMTMRRYRHALAGFTVLACGLAIRAGF